jgi:hypothetical protein
VPLDFGRRIFRYGAAAVEHVNAITDRHHYTHVVLDQENAASEAVKDLSGKLFKACGRNNLVELLVELLTAIESLPSLALDKLGERRMRITLRLWTTRMITVSDQKIQRKPKST